MTVSRFSFSLIFFCCCYIDTRFLYFGKLADAIIHSAYTLACCVNAYFSFQTTFYPFEADYPDVLPIVFLLTIQILGFSCNLCLISRSTGRADENRIIQRYQATSCGLVAQNERKRKKKNKTAILGFGTQRTIYFTWDASRTRCLISQFTHACSTILYRNTVKVVDYVQGTRKTKMNNNNNNWRKSSRI